MAREKARRSERSSGGNFRATIVVGVEAIIESLLGQLALRYHHHDLRAGDIEWSLKVLAKI